MPYLPFPKIVKDPHNWQPHSKPLPYFFRERGRKGGGLCWDWGKYCWARIAMYKEGVTNGENKWVEQMMGKKEWGGGGEWEKKEWNY